ncbi:MAG: UDP-N-acetylmuramate dehydrogenase [Rhodospirillaceae bacterium]|nr:UDP-N-acetylmuramate dehydrogenase [Rhodospirillaceae bacterium]
MSASTNAKSLVSRLPNVKGRISENADLSRVTWFRVGGPAEVLFKPDDVDDLAHFLKNRPKDVPVSIIGVGSNLLVRDGGIPGVVVRLGRSFAEIKCVGADIICGAGALDGNVALSAAEAGISGLEFLVGVPGTIGGALRMNAGAYGGEIKDIVIGAVALDMDGTRHELSSEDLGFSYRASAIPADWIFVECQLRGHAAGKEDILARMQDIKLVREQSQPIRTSTGGSTFKNPEGHKAWQLIDDAGCRGLKIGGASISEKHCNFIINDGTATAADIEAVGEEVRKRVKAGSGIDLQWEIRRIGVKPGERGAIQ